MDAVQFEIDGRVAIITINRPEVRNAVDRPTATALVEAFTRFDSDAALSVAVLAGVDGTFCSGADLKAIVDGRGNRVAEDGDGPLGISRMLLSKPTIAAVEGYAVAGGLELALWCDLRVAAENAAFGVFCRRWGVPLMDGGTVRLPRLIGMSHALDMILTGRAVSGVEALRMGLANRLVPPGAARNAAIALAKDIAKWPQVCMRSDRHSAYEQWNLGLDEALLCETRHGLRVLESGETFTGVGTFAKTIGHHGTLRHFVLGTPMLPPFPPDTETALFAMGSFWDAERRFWQLEGVYTTAVGYAGGDAPDPTHDAVSAGGTGHAQAVRVVYEPRRLSFDALLRVFWEGHDPTQATGTAASHQRSAIFALSDTQQRAAEASRDAYQRALSATGRGRIATEIRPAAEFYYADESHQQYLAKHPDSHR